VRRARTQNVIPLATSTIKSLLTEPTAATRVNPTVMRVPRTAEPPFAVK
jgi:hypothetical protein